MRGQLFPPFSMTSPPSSLVDYDAGDCVLVGLVMMTRLVVIIRGRFQFDNGDDEV